MEISIPARTPMNKLSLLDDNWHGAVRLAKSLTNQTPQCATVCNFDRWAAKFARGKAPGVDWPFVYFRLLVLQAAINNGSEFIKSVTADDDYLNGMQIWFQFGPASNRATVVDMLARICSVYFTVSGTAYRPTDDLDHAFNSTVFLTGLILAQHEPLFDVNYLLTIAPTLGDRGRYTTVDGARQAARAAVLSYLRSFDDEDNYDRKPLQISHEQIDTARGLTLRVQQQLWSVSDHPAYASAIDLYERLTAHREATGYPYHDVWKAITA